MYLYFHLSKRIYQSKIAFFIFIFSTRADHGAVFDFCRDFLGSRRELYSFRSIFSSKNAFFHLPLSTTSSPRFPEGFRQFSGADSQYDFKFFQLYSSFRNLDLESVLRSENPNVVKGKSFIG